MCQSRFINVLSLDFTQRKIDMYTYHYISNLYFSTSPFLFISKSNVDMFTFANHSCSCLGTDFSKFRSSFAQYQALVFIFNFQSLRNCALYIFLYGRKFSLEKHVTWYKIEPGGYQTTESSYDLITASCPI